MGWFVRWATATSLLESTRVGFSDIAGIFLARLWASPLLLFSAFNGMGNDPFVDAAESASFPLPGTGKREGGEKTQPLHRFSSHLGKYWLENEKQEV